MIMQKKEFKTQVDLFGEKVKPKEINKIEDHWINMPEYNNKNREKPMKIAIIKFRNEDDFTKFSKLAREHIFNGDLYWGSYKKNVRVAWYPPFDRASNYAYVDEDDERFFDEVSEFEGD